MNTYFISDTHFNHDKLLSKMGRIGFNSIEEHNEIIIDNINKTVDRNDRLVIAGDFSWDHPYKWRRRINCKFIVFVIGNHDKKQACINTFGQVHEIIEIKTAVLNKVVVCHYPMIYWGRSHHGSIHLYGHCHMQREKTLDSFIPNRRSMDIGIDNAMALLGEPRPFSEREIYDLIGNRSGHDDVNFYLEWQKNRINQCSM